MSTITTFRHTAILGLGLVGGSLGLALSRAGLADEIAGYDVLPGRAEEARTRGAITAVAPTPADAVRHADLVVLAAPVLAVRELLSAIAPHLSSDVVVTDVGSTKAAIVRWASEMLPNPARFVGGHPMAGTELSGITAARADLFTGAIWCLTPTPASDHAAVERLRAWAYAIGARVLEMAPAEHDVLTAAISHLPLIAASALMRAVSMRAEWPQASQIAAGGFRDTTRVASGEPRMARDIVLSNADSILPWLDGYIAELTHLRARIAAGDTEVEKDFTAARDARARWLRDRSTQ